MQHPRPLKHILHPAESMHVVPVIIIFALSAVANPIPSPAPSAAPLDERAPVTIPMCPMTICVKRRDVEGREIVGPITTPTCQC